MYVFNDPAALFARVQAASGAVLICDEITSNLLDGAEFLAPLAALPRFCCVLGEAAKSWRELERLCDFLLARDELGRDSLVINFGGGVVSDLGGLAAGLFKRGCAHVNVPTTLLAAADASIGGKTGINTAAGKNLIGMFKEPEAVFVFDALFASLPKAALACGWAEIIKMAICFDAAAFERVAAGISEVQGVQIAAEIKRAVVSRDFRESGERALLNYGHTFAHAIELLSGFCIPHGLAVARGMQLADELARRLNLLSEKPARLDNALAKYGCECDFRTSSEQQAREFIAAMRKDKKNTSGAITTVLRTDSGAMIYRNTPEEKIFEVLMSGC